MATRIISAAVGLVLLAIAVLFYGTLAFNVIVLLITLIALHEIFGAVKLHNKFGMYGWCALFAAFVLLYDKMPPTGAIHLTAGLFVFTAGMAAFAVFHFADIPFSSIAIVYMETIAILFGFSSILLMRSVFPQDGLFYLIAALGCGWLADTGAYFSGRLFGKHKLAPNVSPHKTVEGSLGGLLTNVLALCLIAWGYHRFLGGGPISYPHLIAVATVGALAGMLGDLVASSLKRQQGIKDYGTIMPGHGGIMDRFDSVIFTLPTVLLLSYYLPIVLR
ncbi:phosphatidate cytidylyltransferase [Oscillospiraceae bacterium 52-8]